MLLNIHWPIKNLTILHIYSFKAQCDAVMFFSAGNIIGSGIFISPKGVLEHSGSVGLALVVWVLGGGIAALGSLCYAELGVTIPKSGGDYSYVTEIFGGLVGWVQQTYWCTGADIRSLFCHSDLLKLWIELNKKYYASSYISYSKSNVRIKGN